MHTLFIVVKYYLAETVPKRVIRIILAKVDIKEKMSAISTFCVTSQSIISKFSLQAVTSRITEHLPFISERQ